MNYLLALLLLVACAAPAGAQTTTSSPTPVIDKIKSTAESLGTTLPIKLPTARVTVVLDGSDVRALASVARDLYDFSLTPQGHALIEQLHNGANESQIADRFMDAFDRFVSVRYPSESSPPSPTQLVQIPIELQIWYHGPTLEQVVKEVIDEIFISRPWTRIGARFPRISQRIRIRMVERTNSIYNRIVWRKLRELHPKYLAKVNAEIDRFTSRFKMDPKQVNLRAFSSGQAGWAGLALDGKTVFSRSSREIREAFRDVSDRLEKEIQDVMKKIEDAKNAANKPADGTQPNTASAGASGTTAGS